MTTNSMISPALATEKKKYFNDDFGSTISAMLNFLTPNLSLVFSNFKKQRIFSLNYGCTG